MDVHITYHRVSVLWFFSWHLMNWTLLNKHLKANFKNFKDAYVHWWTIANWLKLVWLWFGFAIFNVVWTQLEFQKKKIREKECSRRKYINPSINGIRSYRPRFSDVNYHTKVKYQSDMFGAFEQWDDRDMRYTNSW